MLNDTQIDKSILKEVKLIPYRDHSTIQLIYKKPYFQDHYLFNLSHVDLELIYYAIQKELGYA